MKLLGVDIGGTFTDLILADIDNNNSYQYKLPSTPGDPSIAMVKGIQILCNKIGIQPSDIDYVMHGTTVGTNSLLTHQGAKTGMITTEGFRDIIHLGRHQRPQHYSIMQEIPWQDRALIKRRFRKVVRERIGPRGEIITELDEEQVKLVTLELRDAGIESIAICFMFSYTNQKHELRAREIVEDVYPEVYVCTSSDVFSQFREFERFTTTAINAFIGPSVKKYIDNLESSLRKMGVGGELRIMRSNGGTASVAWGGRKPVTMLLSGPAAGILAGKWVGGLARREKVISFDVGGTSADIGIITPDGIVEAKARDTWVAGYPVMVPIIDVHSIGTGGGSIAHVDTGGAFRVGPKSAGANPGPACYGIGGVNATVTDGNLLLGRLDKDYFLGGEMKVYPDLAREAVNKLAKSLDLGLLEVAEGIISLVNSSMANAIRSKTIQKGYDPRDFSIVAFGGAGPTHAAEVAASIGISEVIVPLYPGLTSATGLLTTDVKYDEIQNVFMLNQEMDYDRLNRSLDDLEVKIRKQLVEDGLDESNIHIERSADCRYEGQGYELRARIPMGDVTPENVDALWNDFHKIHKEQYHHAFTENPIELVNIRVTGLGRMPKISSTTIPSGGKDGQEAYLRTVKTIFRVNGALQEFETRCYDRHLLKAGSIIKAPAILLQRDTTTVIPPGWRANVEATGIIILNLES